MQMTRRFFLQTTGALGVTCAMQPLLPFGGAPFPFVHADLGVPSLAAAKKTLVVLFLRGGVDGLNLVVPYGDAAYSSLRPGIGLARPGADGGAIDLDGFFGLHPRLAALGPWFESGAATALHAVGYDHNSRSHFEEQDVWETATHSEADVGASAGWLNRYLATSAGRGPVRAVSIGETLPRILRGDVPAFAVREVNDLALPGGRKNDALVADALARAYGARNEAPAKGDAGARAVVEKSGRETLSGIRELEKVTKARYQPRAEYPQTELGRRLREVARLIRADVGLEVAEVDFGGWDTHQNQGRGAGGTFGNLAQTLGDAISAFCEDLQDRLEDTLVLTLSDFGRTASENGTGGTDHGWGNCMLAVGGALAGSKTSSDRVRGSWPGLGADELHQGRDVQHTTDFRDVIGEVVQFHLGNSRREVIIPRHTFESVGLLS